LKDFKFVEKIYKKTLKNLVLYLNKYHETNYNNRYWEIILFKFLERYIFFVYDRWKIIEDIKKEAKKIIDLNFSLGIGGVVTFKNGKISEFLNQIPIEKIVLETDSPYLAPVPYRGKRNESSYIELVAKKIAEVYNLDFDYVNEVTDNNALDIFGN